MSHAGTDKSIGFRVARVLVLFIYGFAIVCTVILAMAFFLELFNANESDAVRPVGVPSDRSDHAAVPRDLPGGRGRERLGLRPGAALRDLHVLVARAGDACAGRLDRSEDRGRQVLMAAPRHRCTANGCRSPTAAPVLPGSAEVGRSERPWCQLDQEWLGLALIQDSLRCLRVIQCRFPAGTGTRIEENSPSSNLRYICSLVANFSFGMLSSIRSSSRSGLESSGSRTVPCSIAADPPLAQRLLHRRELVQGRASRRSFIVRSTRLSHRFLFGSMPRSSSLIVPATRSSRLLSRTWGLPTRTDHLRRRPGRADVRQRWPVLAGRRLGSGLRGSEPAPSR